MRRDGVGGRTLAGWLGAEYLVLICFTSPACAGPPRFGAVDMDATDRLRVMFMAGKLTDRSRWTVPMHEWLEAAATVHDVLHDSRRVGRTVSDLSRTRIPALLDTLFLGRGLECVCSIVAPSVATIPHSALAQHIHRPPCSARGRLNTTNFGRLHVSAI